MDARLIALNFATGQRCANLGTRGEVNPLDGIEHLVDDWEFNVTSPPTVVGNVVVVGSSLADEVCRIQPSGAVLASFDIPAGLHAGPITYKLRPHGKQYLVIAPGGHKRMGSKLGDYIIAYTLP